MPKFEGAAKPSNAWEGEGERALHTKIEDGDITGVERHAVPSSSTSRFSSDAGLGKWAGSTDAAKGLASGALQGDDAELSDHVVGDATSAALGAERVQAAVRAHFVSSRAVADSSTSGTPTEADGGVAAAAHGPEGTGPDRQAQPPSYQPDRTTFETEFDPAFQDYSPTGAQARVRRAAEKRGDPWVTSESRELASIYAGDTHRFSGRASAAAEAARERWTTSAERAVAPGSGDQRGPVVAPWRDGGKAPARRLLGRAAQALATAFSTGDEADLSDQVVGDAMTSFSVARDAAAALPTDFALDTGRRGMDAIWSGTIQRRSRMARRAVEHGATAPGMTIAQRTASTVRAFGSSTVGAARSAASGIWALVASVSGGLLPILGVIALVVVLAAAIGGSGEDPANVGELEGNEAIVAQFLLDKGLNEVQAAAIMGNMSAESSMNPESGNADSGAYGLCQWLGGRKAALMSYAEEKGGEASDIGIQLEYLWLELTCAVSGGWNKGSDWTQFQTYDKESHLDTATEWFMNRFERPSESEKAQSIAKRKSEARRIYESLTKPAYSGSGEDYAAASDGQKRLVDACHSTPSPGNNLCAAWVSHVFRTAGLGPVYGNADDMYYSYCTSSDLDDLKVGMIVAVPSYERGNYAGRIYGHVCIYIGDGLVMENIGHVNTQPLSNWIQYYGTTYPVKWGWAKGVDLSAS